MTHRPLVALLTLSLLTAPAAVAADAGEKVKPRIENLAARLGAGGVSVSYRVSGAFTAELEERILSGIPVIFRHRVDIKLKRGFPVLVDKVLSRTVVRTRVEYDSLTKRYQLVRTVEQRPRNKKLEPMTEEQRRQTYSVEEVRKWMSGLDGVPLLDPARKDDIDRMRVRAEVNLGRSYLLWVIPTSDTVSDEIPLEP